MNRSCRLSEEGLQEATKAIKQICFTQEQLADNSFYLVTKKTKPYEKKQYIEKQCSRPTVAKFFSRKPIDKKIFQAICNSLKLDIGTVIDLETEKLATNTMYAKQESANKLNIKLVTDETDGVITILPKINDSEANNNTFRQQSEAVIVLSGRLLPGERIELNGQEYYVKEVLKELNKKGFKLKIIDIQEGSVKIAVSDSSENLDRLNALFQSKELVEVLGIPIEKVELLNDDIEESDIEDDEKLQLIEKIIAGEVSGNDLVGADLSGAFLYKVDLRGINLEKANLADADLSSSNLEEANLEKANLEKANLEEANLEGANLRKANLRKANLRKANLRKANLEGGKLGVPYGVLYLALPNLAGAYLTVANLEGANLAGANLEGANLEGALVKNALFSNSSGITPEMQRDLERRGAIFGDKSFAKV